MRKKNQREEKNQNNFCVLQDDPISLLISSGVKKYTYSDSVKEAHSSGLVQGSVITTVNIIAHYKILVNKRFICKWLCMQKRVSSWVNSKNKEPLTVSSFWCWTLSEAEFQSGSDLRQDLAYFMWVAQRRLWTFDLIFSFFDSLLTCF